jgi:hypothetical protein
MRLVSREREEVIYTVGVIFGLQKWKVYKKYASEIWSPQ